MSTEKEVENAVKVSLAEWGVKHGQNEEHRIFRDKAITCAQLAFSGGDSFDYTSYSDEDGDVSKEESILDRGLPQGLANAFKYILRQELKIRKHRYYLPVDMLKHSNILPHIAFNAPYYYNRYRVQFEKNKMFEPFKNSDLNPLHRFCLREVERSLYFYHRFADEMFLLGMGFEAAVSLHVVHTNQACLHCSTKGSIKWSGGSNITSAWRDLVCAKCNSSYEIKSKATNDHINRQFGYNNIRGGSYGLFQKLRSEQLASGAKQYLVLVNRETMWPKTGPVWQVHVAEIDCVLPAVSYSTLIHSNKSQLHFKSTVRVKLQTRRIWFKVPAKKVHWQKMARSVYDEHFPDEDWSTMKENLDAILDPENNAILQGEAGSGENPAPLLANDCVPQIEDANDKVELDCTIDESKNSPAPLLAKTVEADTEVANEKEDYATKLQKELEEFSEGVEDWEDLLED